MAPARAFGMPWREAGMLGLLMNTRGLTELILLNVGVSLAVLDGPMFTMMVIMALVTTVMAGPLLRRLQRRDDRQAARPTAGGLPRR
jgi:Kef-type K+ transport system membrane component KefB